MFTQLKIKNFQSLSDATLDLGKITVLIGPSFLGKSAVVRSIRTLVRNRFEASFMKKGASFSQIELREGDTWVQYNRGSSTEYRFSECPEAFTKIGRDVPPQIQEFLNMPEVQFDSDLAVDFNIQQQFDTPFILSMSGFETAKVFGKMMNLDIVVMSSRQISNDVLSLNKEKDKQQTIIDVSVDYIREHYSIELKYSLLKEAVSLQETIESEAESTSSLLSLIADIERNNSEVQILSELKNTLDRAAIDKMLDPPDVLEDILVNIMLSEEQAEILKNILEFSSISEDDSETLISLESFLVDFMTSLEEVSLLKSTLDKTSDIDSEEASSLLSLAEFIKSGTSLNSSYAEDVKALREIDSQLVAHKASFASFLKQNNICPLTKLPFSEDCLKALEGEV